MVRSMISVSDATLIGARRMQTQVWCAVGHSARGEHMWHRLSFSIASAFFGLIAASPNPTAARQVDGTMQLVGRMSVARAAATATAIAGDRVLITGGMAEGGGALREFEVFDASTNRIATAGEMDESRAGHCSATERSSLSAVWAMGGRSSHPRRCMILGGAASRRSSQWPPRGNRIPRRSSRTVEY